MAEAEQYASDEGFRLREYLGVLRYRKWSILAITVLATAAAFLYAQRQTPQYRSESRVLAKNPLAGITQVGSLAPPNMDTEKALVGSTPVTKCAQQLLTAAGFPTPNGAQTTSQPGAGATSSPTTAPTTAASPGPSAAPSAGAPAETQTQTGGATTTQTPGERDPSVLCTDTALTPVTIPPGLRQGLSVSVATNTNLLSIGYISPRPTYAQAAAQSFADAYLYYRTAGAEATINGIVAPLLQQQEDLLQQQDELTLQITDASNDGQPTAGLQTALSSVNNQLNLVQQQLITNSPSKIDPPVLTQEAGLPAAPASPNKPLIIFVGLFVGLAFGIGLSLLRERLDDRLRGRSDLESSLGVPVLAVIPKVPGWRRREESRLITIDSPKSAVAEAYRTLRTSILFTSAQRGMKTLMITSPTAGEGKTTTACNLAVSLADANKRVIVISADLRKPRLHKFFKQTNDKGLANVLAGEVKPWEALQDPQVPNLRIMASGPVPSRPAELLQSEQMGELLAELREVADIILLDTAPVLLVADALALAPLVDGVLVIADAENTSSGSIAHAREQMEQVSAPLVGAVFNNFDPSKARGYGYGYGYGYGGYRYRYGAGYGYGYGGTYAQAPEDGEPRRRARLSRGE